MSERWGISGKRVELPEAPAGWRFSLRPGGWVVGDGPGGARARFMLCEARGRLSASMGGRLWNGEVAADARGGGHAGAGDLTAQFPGKVRKVLVADGARVVEGDSLVLVEAMKMEFAVKAPSAGVIKKVLVREGQQLSPGDAFVDFEAADG